MNTAILAVIEAKNNETKSSAGDKHETGRAMMQLEEEKHERQLSKALQLKNLLDKIDIKKQQTNVVLGSLVTTNQASYFFSVGIGKLKLDEQTYFAISLDSPIGQVLVGKTVGETVTFRGKEIVIQEIQ